MQTPPRGTHRTVVYSTRTPGARVRRSPRVMCVCLLLQYLLQSCSRGVWILFFAWTVSQNLIFCEVRAVVLMAPQRGPVMAPLPVPGRSLMWTESCCWEGCLVLVRGCVAYHTVSVSLLSGAALIGVSLDVWPLPPRSSLQTVAGCLLGG